MRVLQLIDSLNAGGAERMAVNYANALAERVEESHLCCTRKEGILKEKISRKVSYLFLGKSSTFDWKAFQKLDAYINKNKISIVHAHSSSWFLTTLVKILRKRSLKIVWHDHYGNSEFLKKRPKKALQFFSGSFDGIICVNNQLKEWAIENLKCKNVKLFNNFIAETHAKLPFEEKLKGGPEDFKLISVANLRPQKDQLTLIKAFNLLEIENASLHFVGMNFKDTYYQKFWEAIEKSGKKDHIFYYGSSNQVGDLLMQGSLGIVSSVSEGLPLIILEYALAGLPVLSTEVGKCKDLIGNDGFTVKPSDPEEIKEAIHYIYTNFELAQEKALKLNSKVRSKFTERAVIPKILNFYQTL